MFTYLAQELRTRDVAVRGSEAYAHWAAKLLSWEQCEPLLDEFCAEAGLPSSAESSSSSCGGSWRRRPRRSTTAIPTTPIW